MTGHFPEATIIATSLATSRDAGVPFQLAWADALRTLKRERHPHARRGGLARDRWNEIHEVFRFARPAYERAYNGKPPTRQDVIARALLHAMEAMYDESRAVAPTPVAELMEAA